MITVPPACGEPDDDDPLVDELAQPASINVAATAAVANLKFIASSLEQLNRESPTISASDQLGKSYSRYPAVACNVTCVTPSSNLAGIDSSASVKYSRCAMQRATGGQQPDDELIVERRGAVQWVIFNRPAARNAMTWNMYERLAAACNAVNEDKTVQAVVLTGAGGEAFVSGTDIGQFRTMSSERDFLDYERRGSTVLRTVESVRVPTIAAIAGPCTGAGAAIANCCDLRIASPSARYGFPIARTLGNGLSMANYARAMALLGIARVKDLIFRARLMSAAEMLSAGLVTEVTADEGSLLPRAQELAEEVAAHAPLTLWVTKASLQRIRDRLVPPDDDSALLLSVYMSSDFREGVDAFLAKRRPRWTGE